MGNINSKGHDGELSSAERAANAKAWDRETRGQRHADLLKARGALVAKYRISRSSFPDGVDTKYDRWYRAEEWTDGGGYIGPEPCVRGLNPDSVKGGYPDIRDSGVKAMVLSARIVTEPDDSLPETVTKSPSPRHENHVLDKTSSVQTPVDKTVDKTPHAGGRPKKVVDPWVVEGISKSAWYAKRKKATPDAP